MNEHDLKHAPDDKEQLKKYAEDLAAVYKSEKEKRKELEKINSELFIKRTELLDEIKKRVIAEDELRALYNDLEQIVHERTSQLESLNRDLESFTYSVSHDLKAPLRHINGFIELAKKEMAGSCSEKAGHYLDVIEKSAVKMGHLIDDLLAFSRLGRTALSLCMIKLDELVDDVLQDFSDSITVRGTVVRKAALPEIYGDYSMLRVVLVNLVSNAVKFTSGTENPVIEIGHKKVKSGFEIFIRDNGAGFDMRFAERMFGVFQRLHSDQEYEGTGIGLAMVKNIIERHGGEIRAEGEVGMGACFYFVLPDSENSNNTGECNP